MQEDPWRPHFWKLSHGSLKEQEMLEAIEGRLVYVHYGTPPKGGLRSLRVACS